MKLTIVVLFAFVAIAMSMPTPTVEVSDDEWSAFKNTHNKVYDDQSEDNRRRGIYLNTKKMVEEHNKKYEAGEVSFSLGINQFADLTDAEIKKNCCGLKIPENLKN